MIGEGGFGLVFHAPSDVWGGQDEQTTIQQLCQNGEDVVPAPLTLAIKEEQQK